MTQRRLRPHWWLGVCERREGTMLTVGLVLMGAAVVYTMLEAFEVAGGLVVAAMVLLRWV
jgi:hypothetical protein